MNREEKPTLYNDIGQFILFMCDKFSNLNRTEIEVKTFSYEDMLDAYESGMSYGYSKKEFEVRNE